MYYNPVAETADKETLSKTQSEHLKNLVAYVYKNNAVFKNRLDEKNIRPADITSIADITKLPFTTKEDMRDFYPYQLFCVPQAALAEIHVSSGTTGNPTLSGYTKKDLDIWGEAMARSLRASGARKGDMIQIAYGYGLFTGGLGAHYGALALGLTILPMSSGNTKRQIKLMQDLKPRVLACTPSYALYLAEEAAAAGLKPKDISWQIGVFGAEPWSDAMRSEIEQKLGIKAYDVFGLSEIIGPGVAMECECQNGLHVWSDLFYPEIINPKTGEHMKDGLDGELVITALTKEAIPLLRYRTRDIASMTTEKCPCGRTAPRISKLKGRTDDMVVIRGINIFPSQVEHALLQIDGAAPHYQLIVDRHGALDSLELEVEVEEQFFKDKIGELLALEDTIKHALASALNISARVRLLEPGAIQRSEGKAKRVIDRRKL